jgi:hypothetical protein
VIERSVAMEHRADRDRLAAADHAQDRLTWLEARRPA